MNNRLVATLLAVLRCISFRKKREQRQEYGGAHRSKEFPHGRKLNASDPMCEIFSAASGTSICVLRFVGCTENVMCRQKRTVGEASSVFAVISSFGSVSLTRCKEKGDMHAILYNGALWSSRRGGFVLVVVGWAVREKQFAHVAVVVF